MTAGLAYLWGEDAFAIERALAGLASSLGEPDVPLETWRVDGQE